MNTCRIGPTKKGAEALVCRLYSVHKTYSICTAWHMLFSKTCEPEEMSPTSDALHFHLMRVTIKQWYGELSIVQYLSFLTLRIRASSDVTESNYQKFMDMISFTCLLQCAHRRCKCRKSDVKSISIVIVIVIVISKLLKRYSKAKRTRAPAYS